MILYFFRSLQEKNTVENGYKDVPNNCSIEELCVHRTSSANKSNYETTGNCRH